MGTFATPQLGKIDVALSNYAQQFRNFEFIADALAPRVPVVNQGDKYRIFDKDSLKDPGDEVRAPGATAIELTRGVSTDTYACVDHAVTEIIPRENLAIPGMPDQRQAATQTSTERILLKREKRMKDIATNAANFSASNKVTLAGATQWSATTGTPIADVLAARKQVGLMGKPANLMIIGPDTFEALKVHKEISDRFTNVKAGATTRQDLEAVFEMRVVVAGGVIVSAADVPAYLWPDSAFIGHVQDTPSMDDISFMKTFVWVAAPGTTQGFMVVESDVSPASRNAIAIDVHFWYDDKITSKDSGYLIIDTNA